MKHTGGYFVISLDFELNWGMFDTVTLESYGKHFEGVHTVVPDILTLFQEHQIHATWGTVGMLMCKDKADLLSVLPDKALQPEYPDTALSSYKHIETHDSELTTTPEMYFAPDLVRKIVRTEGQELASHTFCHYYCIAGRENGEAIFTADCLAQKRITEIFGVTPTSLIFPRNQATDEALRTAYKNGITAYRGNEDSFLYRNGTESSLFVRGWRLIDHYLNLTGHHTHAITPVKWSNGTPTNIPASRFLRPWSKFLSVLEPLRMRRIKNAMTYAAKNGEIFHLWWHPHNFGVNQAENMQNLKTIITHFETLKETYGMESVNMKEITTRAIESDA